MRVQLRALINPSPTVATITPDSSWQGTAGSSSGSTPNYPALNTSAAAPTFSVTPTTVDPTVTTTGGGDGVAYGLQSISAMALDPSSTSCPAGNCVQLTVPSTAAMHDGDQFRTAFVDNAATGLTGIDGDRELKVIDATHVDQCSYINPSNGACVFTAAFYPSQANLGSYSGGGKIWHDQSLPAAFDEHPNAWIDPTNGTITVGAASNTKSFNTKVTFCLDVMSPSTCVDVTKQTISPTRPDIFGWAVQLKSRPGLDGIANLYAIITPANGFQRVLGPLPVILNTNGTIQTYQKYVDNTDPNASDSLWNGSTGCDGSAPATSEVPSAGHCPFRTIERATCSAFLNVTGSDGSTGASAKARVVINVGGPADTLYQENNALGCTAINNPYTVEIHGTNKIYITGATSADSINSNSGHNWIVKARNAIVSNVSIDTEVGGFGTAAFGTSPYAGATTQPAMLWLGPNTTPVAWGGLTIDKHGARGPIGGYLYPGNAGRKVFRTYIGSDFVGIGESDMDTITAQQFNLIRDVKARLSQDAIQYGLGVGTDTKLAIFNYRAQPNIFTNSYRYHYPEAYLTVSAVAAGNYTSYSPTCNYGIVPGSGSSSSSYYTQITYSTSPYDAPGLDGTPNTTPTYVMLFGSNGVTYDPSTLYFSSGASNSFPVFLSTTSTFSSSNKTQIVYGSNPSIGCPQVAVNDKAVSFYIQHGDCFQVITGPLENVYAQNYECAGDNRQPILIQSAASYQIASMTTVGKNFTLNPVGAVDPSASIQLLQTDTAVPGPAGRRVASLHYVTPASFTGSFTGSAASPGAMQITVTDSTGGALQRGMSITPTTNLGNIVVLDTQASSTSCPSGSATDCGVWNIIVNNGGVKNLQQSATNRVFTGIAVDSGTLTAAFPTDITNQKVYKTTMAKDVGFVNYLLDGNYTDPIAGVVGQVAEGNRNVFFFNLTQVDPPPVQSSFQNSQYPYSFTLINGQGAPGFYVEDWAFRNSLPGIMVQASSWKTSDGVSHAYAAGTSHPGVAMVNSQYTHTNGSLNIQGALPAGAGAYFPGSKLATPSFLAAASLVPTNDALDAANVPFDINMVPRVAGSPIGAVAQ